MQTRLILVTLHWLFVWSIMSSTQKRKLYAAIAVASIVSIFIFLHLSFTSDQIPFSAKASLQRLGLHTPRSKHAFAVFLAEPNENIKEGEEDYYYFGTRMLIYQLLHDPESRTNTSVEFLVMVTENVPQWKTRPSGERRCHRPPDRRAQFRLDQARPSSMEARDGQIARLRTHAVREDPPAGHRHRGDQTAGQHILRARSPSPPQSRQLVARARRRSTAAGNIPHGREFRSRQSRPPLPCSPRKPTQRRLRAAEALDRNLQLLRLHRLHRGPHRRHFAGAGTCGTTPTDAAANMPWQQVDPDWNVNTPIYNDYEHGVASFHEKYWGCGRDRRLRDVLLKSRWKMEGFFNSKP